MTFYTRSAVREKLRISDDDLRRLISARRLCTELLSDEGHSLYSEEQIQRLLVLKADGSLLDFKPKVHIPHRVRVNEHIDAPEVQVLNEEGVSLGIHPTERAIKYARELGLDLVEVGPKAVPPLCKAFDFTLYKIEASSTYGKKAQAPPREAARLEADGTGSPAEMLEIDFVSAYPQSVTKQAETQASASPDLAHVAVVRKASPIGDTPIAHLRIVATETFPDMTARGRPYPEFMSEARAEHTRDGKSIVDALLATMPGGTIDAILLALLEHRASVFRVPATPEPVSEPAPELARARDARCCTVCGRRLPGLPLGFLERDAKLVCSHDGMAHMVLP